MTIWDPHTEDLSRKVEMVQWPSARFVLRRYHQTSSVWSMLEELRWDRESLRVRRANYEVALLYKAVNDQVCTDCGDYLTPITTRADQNHSRTFRQIKTRSNYHKYSFYARTISLWNSLPAHIREAPSLEIMKEGLKKFAIPYLINF